jgi:transient receptor potential cation channel subfamily A protein 1
MLPLALRQQRRTHKKSRKSDPFGSHHQPQKQQQRKPSAFRRKVKLESPKNSSRIVFCRYGRYNTARQLLDSEKGTFIINESDGEGLTPLHIASKQGHTRVVQLLLNRGALLHRDHNGRNPLHLAAMNGYTQTIELLLSVHSHLLDQTDKDGNTALHLATMENKPNAIALLLSVNCKLLYNHMEMSAIDYAIYYKFPEAALAMVTHEDRAQEVMSLKSSKHPYVTLALIASMPRVFEAVQDKCITKANCKKDSKSFYVGSGLDSWRHTHLCSFRSSTISRPCSAPSFTPIWTTRPETP